MKDCVICGAMMPDSVSESICDRCRKNLFEARKKIEEFNKQYKEAKNNES